MTRGKVAKIFIKQCVRSAFGRGWAVHKNKVILTFIETSGNPHIMLAVETVKDGERVCSA